MHEGGPKSENCETFSNLRHHFCRKGPALNEREFQNRVSSLIKAEKETDGSEFKVLPYSQADYSNLQYTHISTGSQI